ncbi:DUF255 domain-containing protein [Tunturiibacter gelidoferens]|uniref:DUF255 domain-containing protein n=2 Tax=Tunturiibacter gelidiferens TaxID=3069689 RepID=A0AAU7Z4N2_9BACT|nr:DUF255 domain-containing protein [Edaphobacter lichenicola]MBB5340485.1 hypothetical protein [Edaphobacter lichenicola]
MRFRSAVLISVMAITVSGGASGPTPQAALHWQAWSDGAFVQARAEHKFVLLDLEAVWCHWCHVMDDVTYRDPAVVRLLNQKYVLVKVDQDSRPDISNRYQDYGWPATVVFAADGSEIVKRQGYLPPRLMSSMLQAIIDDPSPGPSVEREATFRPASGSAISAGLLTRIETLYEKQYDKPIGGWGFVHKYLDEESVEYAMRQGARGNREYAKRAADTLHDATNLLDPVWGGMYQYSVGRHWTEPHFEKLISIQADELREYSLAYAETQNPEDLKAAQSVHRYVTNFLTAPSAGVFFVSQDADLHDGQENEAYFKLQDAGRRAQGMPRVDTHVYSRENGWMIAALCDYYAASGDGSALLQAQRAAAWIVVHRSLPGGGFRHDDVDAGGPYLGDTLAMGQAFLALYNVTGDRGDLKAAAATGQYIAAHFAPAVAGGGFVTAQKPTDAAYRPHPDRDENVAVVRFASALAVASGEERFRAAAAEAMRYLAAESVALLPLSAGVLLANEDMTEAPIHVTVVGPAASANVIALHAAALRSITSHELIEVRDPADPAPLPTSVTYPALKQAALFLCTAHACSSPIFRGEDVRAKIQRAELQAR